MVVYPQAAGDPAEWNLEAENNPDLDFMRDMIAYLEAHLNVDPKRIYATGISNGGGMANRMGCSMADMIAAIAPVSGSYWYWEACDPARPLPVAAFHGDADNVVPYEGFEVGEENLPQIEAWAAAWAERNQCGTATAEIYNFGEVVGKSWQNCAADATVTLYTIAGGKHTWPGSTNGTQDIDASDAILAFFGQHSLP
jgi:polyhydroxybutyrate depolymerase